MNYFTKISAYFDKELSDLECLVFEQELAENATLQAEVAAYEMAQSLFGFAAEALPTEEIIGTEAAETADELITFVASNLSEEQILGAATQVDQPTVIRQLKPRRNRMAWLAAASMLFIISMMGLRFQSNQASWETLGQDGPVAVTAPAEKIIAPIVKEITPIVKEEKVNQLVSTPTTEKDVKSKVRIYEPAIVKVVKKQQTNSLDLAANSTRNSSKKEQSNLLALNTTATKITTGKVIDRGQAVVYKAGNSVVLKEGFHAKAGSSFLAKTSSDNKTSVDYSSAATITGSKKVVYQANKTITLKPGFHATAGTNFVAKTAFANNKEVATNTIISDKESVLVKASNSITLKAGFHAKAGANFTAKVAK